MFYFENNEYDNFYENYKDESYENEELESNLSFETIKHKNEDKNFEKKELINKIKTGLTGPTGLTLNQKQVKKEEEDLMLINSNNFNKANNEYLPIENNQKINDDNSTTKKNLGRKRKSSNEIGEHNKYSEDNLIRKIKSFVISYLSNFINSFICRIYGNIGEGIFKKELKKMNQNQIIDTKNNKEFLCKTLKDIFSEDISRKYNNYPKEHNRNLIQKLLNEEDEDKREKFKNLFSLTFLDCLKHIRGSKYLKELEGLESYDNMFKQFENDKEYFALLNHCIFNFEIIIMRKRKRKISKKKSF